MSSSAPAQEHRDIERDLKPDLKRLALSVIDRAMSALRTHPDVKRQVAPLEREVERGALTPSAAARRLLDAFLGR